MAELAPARGPSSICSRPLSRLSPLVSIARSITCGLVSAKLDGAIASTNARVVKRSFSRGSPRPPPRSRRPRRAAGRRPANRSGGSCRRADCRAIPGRRSAGPCRPSPRARSARCGTPSARCQIDSPSVHRSACICMILAGSANIVMPGQAAAAFSPRSGAGAAFAASPICRRDAPSSAAGRGPSPRSNAACPPGSASGTAARPARRRPWCRGRP